MGAISGVRIELSFLRGPDAVVNDPAVTSALASESVDLLGEPNVRAIAQPSLGGEDFAAYLRLVPGCLLRLGVATPGKQPWPCLHSSLFDIDERVLVIGAKLLARGAVRLSSEV
jgi:amidohydrolase